VYGLLVDEFGTVWFSVRTFHADENSCNFNKIVVILGNIGVEYTAILGLIPTGAPVTHNVIAYSERRTIATGLFVF